jgi:hypothetical protein
MAADIVWIEPMDGRNGAYESLDLYGGMDEPEVKIIDVSASCTRSSPAHRAAIAM